MANAGENAKPGRRKRAPKEPDGDKAAEAEATAKAEKTAEAEKNDAEKNHGGSKASGARDAFSAAIEGLTRLYTHGAEHGGVSPQVTDAVTQALTLVLGASPSVVALDGLMSMQTANGIMYYNAVANQQKTNMIGMAMTARCVRHMLGPDHRDFFDETVVVDKDEEE